MPSTVLKNAFPKSLLLLGLGVFLFIFFFRPIETEDIWWHLSTGQWIMQHGQVPHQDPFPFANEQTPWICIHWLGSTILYLIYKVSGYLGLKIFRSLFFFLALGIFYRYCRRFIPFHLSIVLVLLMTFGIIHRPSLRPDMFNFIFVQLFLINLLAYQNNGNNKKLFILPFLGILWFNIHLGAFFYGIPLIVIFLASACAKYLNIKLKQTRSDEITAAKKEIKDLALTLLFYLLGFLINPYGLEGALFPFKTFFLPEFSNFYGSFQVIGEMQPATYIFTSLKYCIFLILILLGFLNLFLTKKNYLTSILLFIVSLFAFMLVGRNSGFFTLVSSYVIVEGCRQIQLKDIYRKFSWSKVIDSYLSISFIAIFMLQTFYISSQKMFYSNRATPYLAVINNPLHEFTIRLLIKNSISGPIFNSDPVGGELIWRGYPTLRPFLDGRFINIDRFHDFNFIIKNPEKVWPIAQRFYNFKIVLLDISGDDNLNFIQYLNKQPDWQLISINGTYVTYIKRGTYPHLSKSLDELEVRLKSIPVSINDLKLLQELCDRPRTGVLEEFLHPSAVDTYLIYDTLTLMHLGYPGAAVKQLIKALKISHDPFIHQIAMTVLGNIPKKAGIAARF